MSLFSAKPSDVRCGAIVDIGSGSVGLAIVVSNTDIQKLEIVWSHREYILTKEKDDMQVLLKEISTALINALLELGNAGIKALYEHNPELSIKHIQTTISAPWSYTVTKRILYEDESEFTVTKELIAQLIESAKSQTQATIVGGKAMEDLGLQIITDATLGVELNQYAVVDPQDKRCTSIQLSYLQALAEIKILATIDELHKKILPKAELEHNSFMYVFYQVLRYLHPNTSEICLIDVTDEATEIGIVREGILQHTAHTKYGMYSIARSIAQTCGIPKEEALGLLKTEGGKESYPQEMQNKIQQVFDSYTENISKLFLETGDALSIPRTLFLHTSVNTEEFFSQHIKLASEKVTNDTHTIHLCTSELFKNIDLSDTALILSADFFHNKELYTSFYPEK